MRPMAAFIRSLRYAVLLCVLAAACAPALAIYKCEANGKTSYSDTPCPGGRQLDIDRQPVSTADTARAERQAAREKAQAKQIEHEKHKAEAQEEKEKQRAAHAVAARRKRCSLLERRKNWAEEDVVSAKGKSVTKARLKAKRVEQQFEEECAPRKGMIAG